MLGSQPSSNPTSEPRSEPGLAVRSLYWLYRSVLSPVLHAFSPAQCVYLPTCSEYAYVALVRFGVLKGSWLALRRLARCHPFAKGGFDPVPLLSGCETPE
jgi:putative membrane protein insertion efficiency factor